jgi:hypothetical protein
MSNVDGGGRGDVVTRLRISGRLVQGESVQRDDFFPRQLIGGAPAHTRQHIALLDEPAHPAAEFRHAPIWITANARRVTASDAMGVAVV